MQRVRLHLQDHVLDSDEQESRVAPASSAKGGGAKGARGDRQSRAGSQRQRQAAGEREENKRRSPVGHSQTNPSLSGRGESSARKGK